MHRYRNPWHRPHEIEYGPEFFTCDASPIEYRGFQIFRQRVTKSWELVKDGVCLTQRCGPMQKTIDDLHDGTTNDEHGVARIRDIADRHGVSLPIPVDNMPKVATFNTSQPERNTQ